MAANRAYWVYILASDVGGTLYIGVTNDLVRRVYEHRTDAIEGFSQTYQVHRLVYFEQFNQIEFAIQSREAAQEVDAGLEGGIDRENQSTLD
jgi:putative endonuclease